MFSAVGADHNLATGVGVLLTPFKEGSEPLLLPRAPLLM